MLDIDIQRQQFMRQGLRKADLEADPYDMFESWYTQTIVSDLAEPTAMCLSTIDATGQPWQRMVLLKTFDRNGFVFYTNYASRKASHMENCNKVSILFPWHPLGRQVIVTGTADKVSTAESIKYFITRPRGSQIGAWASPQSQVISNRALLDTQVEEMKHKFNEGEVPLPSFWGGYRISPMTFEFWQARENRIHDRFMYCPDEQGNWHIDRLAP